MGDSVLTPATLPSVAICLAGALRDFSTAYASIERHMIEPNHADVFVVTASEMNSRTGSRSGRYFAQKSNVSELADIVGEALRGAVVWTDEDLKPERIASWAGAHAANASRPTTRSVYSWAWYLKRWACLELVLARPSHRLHGKNNAEHGQQHRHHQQRDHDYDIVVTMRPDLLVFEPWHFSAGNGSDSSIYTHTIGSDAPVHFGAEEVVVHDFSVHCQNDWASVATLGAATTLEQLVHHLASTGAFAPCTKLENTMSICCELLMGAFLWRAGLQRRRTNLHIEMLRKVLPSMHAFNHSSGGQALSWPGNADFEKRNLRRNNRGAWQAYCETDPNFEHYADGFTLGESDSGGSTLNLSKATGTPRLPGFLPGVYSPLANVSLTSGGNASRCGGAADAVRPPCEPIANLSMPLPPCVRRSLDQRVIAWGFGRRFPWWLHCEGPCTPLPNSFYFDHNGSVLPVGPTWPHPT